MSHHAGHYHYHLVRIRLSELRRLYWAHTVKELASSLVTIFVPIYLYHLGYGIPAIMGYFLLSSIFWGVTQAPALRFANRIGFNRSMGLSLMIQGLQILMLATLPSAHWPLWSIALVWGVSISLYWTQFRACFARSLSHRRVGPAVGVSSALLMLAYGIAPAIGGAIASWLGISVLYVLTMLCFLAAALPLLTGPEFMEREPFKLRDLHWRKVRRDLIANGGSEVDAMVATSVWPLFIFLLIPSYVGVGILSSVAVIASIIIALYVGQRQARKMTGYLNNGAGVIGLTNAIRLAIQSIGQIAGVNFFNGIGQALVVTPFYSRYYLNAEREPLLPYMYAMLMACAAADILLFGFLLILSLLVSTKTVLILGLILAIPGGYAIRFIRTSQTI
jgi:MFS family permease